MHFHFGTRKIVEAAAAVLRCEPCNRMGYMRLLKLLYIADRRSLQRTGRPIVGTCPVAMKLGPVLSEVLDLVRGKHYDEAVWSEFIRKDGYEVEQRKDPGVLSLSRYEIEELGRVSAECREYGDSELVEKTHEFPEWKKNFVEGTSTPIPLADIVEAVGRSADRDEILRDAEASRALGRRLLGCGP